MTKPKRSRDPNQLAKLVVGIATGEVEPDAKPDKDEATLRAGARAA